MAEKTTWYPVPLKYTVLIASLSITTPVSSATTQPNKDLKKIDIEVSAIDNRVYVAEADFIVEAPYQDVWEVIIDIDHMDQFMKNFLYGRTVSEADAKVLLDWKDRSFQEIREFIDRDKSPVDKRLKKAVWGQEVENYVVEFFDLPWPIKNRWVIFKCWDRAGDRVLTRKVEAVGGLMKGYGLWRVEPHPENPSWTVVHFGNTTILDFQVPKFIGKRVSRYASESASESVRDRVEQLAMQ
ncbi:MAG: hypothetical protein HYT76_04255 [Deltaproteobacteria bacterium]|nr:hypothetical protein [Deltaproteobacteria bacterium]